MMLILIPLLTFGLPACSGKGALSVKEGDSANAYVDALLMSMSEDYKKEMLDPLYLNDIEREKQRLQNIEVTGMSNLTRGTDVAVMKFGGVTYLITDVSAKNVSIIVDCCSKMLFFEVHGEIIFFYEELTFRLILANPKKNVTAALFQVTQEGNNHVKYNGYIMVGGMSVALAQIIPDVRANILEAIGEEAKGAFTHDPQEIFSYLAQKSKIRDSSAGSSESKGLIEESTEDYEH